MPPKTLDLGSEEELSTFRVDGEASVIGKGMPIAEDVMERKAAPVSAVPELWKDEANSASDDAEVVFSTAEAPKTQRERPPSPFRASYASLASLRSTEDAADWLEAAAVLKHDAVRLRKTNLSRHVSVLLALADALTYTEPTDPALTEDATNVFSDGLALLSEPFVREADEEAFLVELLAKGWNLAPAVDLRSLAE